ncbi:hypothetical protein [Halorussus caseinilyticus]|uniref:Uncharacterized protein n=1 Tax=Halorussus caseinilyticus TaxID=3034025 RepID=A0ABD5WIR7_9EURY|nr:hypothetical protein [Halorussus sp. DT72]
MPDTKDGREKKAADRERRQREREIDEARRRADEAEPPDEAESGDSDADSGEIRRAETRREERSDSPSECHRRGCDEPPAFAVLERYQEETGHGAVEAEAFLCQEHTAEESPVNLDAAYPDYVFRVVPV